MPADPTPNPFMCIAPKDLEVDDVIKMGQAILHAMSASFEVPTPPHPKIQMYAMAAIMAYIHTNLTREDYVSSLEAFRQVTTACFDLNTRAKAHTDVSTSRH
jgi:hypothetical protein